MSKELEALERIIETFYNKDSEDIKLVRNALKNYDFLKRMLNRNWVEVMNDGKKSKAFEIIKEKGIILSWIKEIDTVEAYNAGVYGTSAKPLTQEEFILLKEVL